MITECDKCGHDHTDSEPFYCMRCVRELNQQINDLTNELAKYKSQIQRWADRYAVEDWEHKSTATSQGLGCSVCWMAWPCPTEIVKSWKVHLEGAAIGGGDR